MVPRPTSVQVRSIRAVTTFMNDACSFFRVPISLGYRYNNSCESECDDSTSDAEDPWSAIIIAMTEVTGKLSPLGSHDSILRVGLVYSILNSLFQFYFTPYTYVQIDIRDIRDFRLRS